MKSKIIFRSFLTCFLAFFLCGQAAGQKAYPVKGIDIMVPFGPGGGADVVARINAMYLAQEWKVPVNVVNKAGGSAIPGIVEALMAKPDGYMMFTESHSTGVILDAFSPTPLPFDWRNRTFICRTVVEPAVYLVRPDAPWKNLKEVAEFALKNPKKIRWGVTGGGGVGFAAGAQFFVVNKIPIDQVNKVSFKGGMEVYAALAGSHVDFGAQEMASAISMVYGKKVRALAVVAEKRNVALPDVPTVAEVGYPTLDVFSWHGIAGPPGLSEDIVKKWVETLRKAATDPKFLKMAENVGKTIGFLGPEEYKEFAEAKYKKYLELAKESGMKK